MVGFFRVRTGVLFVCTANICRSPAAEAVFRASAARAGIARALRIDSAGTHAGHLGERIDPRAVAALKYYGIAPPPHRARQVQAADFRKFEWIFAMDAANLRALREVRPPDCTGHLGLLMDLAPHAGHAEVPDPYYGPSQTFDLVVRLALAAMDVLVTRLSEPPA